MEMRRSSQPNFGLTLMDVVIAIVIVVAIAALLLPLLAKTRSHPPYMRCMSNLKQVGLAARMWANDHDDRFPWQVPTAKGGTMELAGSAEMFRHLLVMSNEISSPKVLVCSIDEKRTKVTNFAQLNNRHVSYFVSLDAQEGKPASILLGDRNIVGGTPGGNGVLRILTNSQVGWGTDMHIGSGNIGFADGSAMQTSSNNLRKLVQADLHSKTNDYVIRLAIPR